MNQDDPKKPGLRVLPEQQSLEKLERPQRSRPPERAETQGSNAFESAEAQEDVEVLQPDQEARLDAKSFEPDVAEILDNEEAELDSEDNWGTAVRKTPPLGWFVLAGILICSLAMWAAVTVFKAQPEREEVIDEKKELAIDKVKEVKEVRKTLGAMQSCVRGYLMAKSVDEKLAYVRHPDRVKPLMQNYYQSNEFKVEGFRHFEKIRSMGLDSLSFVFGRVELDNGLKHQLLLEQLEDGSFKVDWESDVCYLPIPWGEFVVGDVMKPVVMRVFIKRDTFFAYDFRDEDKFDCYKLTTRDSDDHVFGFVEKGSKVAADINRFFKRLEENGSKKAEPVMLTLRYPDNKHSKKCVWIESLVAQRWTYVKADEGESSNSEAGE